MSDYNIFRIERAKSISLVNCRLVSSTVLLIHLNFSVTLQAVRCSWDFTFELTFYMFKIISSFFLIFNFFIYTENTETTADNLVFIVAPVQ